MVEVIRKIRYANYLTVTASRLPATCMNEHLLPFGSKIIRKTHLVLVVTAMCQVYLVDYPWIPRILIAIVSGDT